MLENLKNLIDDAQSIVITGHLGPDADSLASALLALKILEINLPGKHVTICMEEEIGSLSFLDNYETIKFKPLAAALADEDAQLLLVLDANNLSRCTREPDNAAAYIKDHAVKLAIIDHHQNVNADASDVYINQGSPAVTQDVFEIFTKQMGFKKPGAYAQNAITGIYFDTGGFTYDNPRYRETFAVVSELIDDGASTELAAANLSRYSGDSLLVVVELINNLRQTADFSYSFISDEFYERWLAEGRDTEKIHDGYDIFLHYFLRNIDGQSAGFLVRPDHLSNSKVYSVSLRSTSGTIDVSHIAQALGGGGHKPAAGAKVSAENSEEAVNKVLQAIEQSPSS